MWRRRRRSRFLGLEATAQDPLPRPLRRPPRRSPVVAAGPALDAPGVTVPCCSGRSLTSPSPARRPSRWEGACGRDAEYGRGGGSGARRSRRRRRLAGRAPGGQRRRRPWRPSDLEPGEAPGVPPFGRRAGSGRGFGTEERGPGGSEIAVWRGRLGRLRRDGRPATEVALRLNPSARRRRRGPGRGWGGAASGVRSREGHVGARIPVRGAERRVLDRSLTLRRGGCADKGRPHRSDAGACRRVLLRHGFPDGQRRGRSLALLTVRLTRYGRSRTCFEGTQRHRGLICWLVLQEVEPARASALNNGFLSQVT